MPVLRAFISFQVEDQWARNLIVYQAHNTSYNGVQFIDFSVHEPFDEKWKTNCRARIAKTKGTIILIGRTTWRSEAVLWEIEETRSQKHPLFGIQINRGKTHRIPKGLPESKVIRWNEDSIERQLGRWT